MADVRRGLVDVADRHLPVVVRRHRRDRARRNPARREAARLCDLADGFRSTKEESNYAWQPLAALGLTTFSIDFRFHRPGARKRTTTGEVHEQPAKFRAMMRGTVGDLRSAIDYLEKQPYCAKNIAYVGVSLGGAVGTIVAARDQRVRAAVLVVTPGTWSGLPTVPAGVSAFDPDRYVGKIAPRPVLIMSGLTDTTVPIANARRLQAAARRPKTVVNFDSGHDLRPVPTASTTPTRSSPSCCAPSSSRPTASTGTLTAPSSSSSSDRPAPVSSAGSRSCSGWRWRL